MPSPRGPKKLSHPVKRSLVSASLRGRIQKGEISPGERLVSVRELADAYNVSLSVVQNALKELCDGGFLECQPGRGYYVAEKPEKGKGAGDISHAPRGELCLVLDHHSDLLWRRTLADYDAIRESQLLSLFAMARRHPSCAFLLEQGRVGQVFFAAHPELLSEARELVSQGRLDLGGAYSIPDLNMVEGESILRNLLAGAALWRELLGKEPAYARLVDAFGMCAQLPQILLHCGIRHLWMGRAPNVPASLRQAPFFRWRSLGDSSRFILAFQPQGTITHLGYTENVPLIQKGESRLVKGLRACQTLSGSPLISYSTEEGELEESIFAIAGDLNAGGGKPVSFLSAGEYLRLHTPREEEIPEYRGECNPIFTGCYTTRIGIKQGIRQAESRLLLLELLDLLASPRFHSREKAWHALFLAQFHDAVCGCHSDAAHGDVEKALREAIPPLPSFPGEGFTVVSSSGVGGRQPVSSPLPPAGIPSQEDGEGGHLFLADLPRVGLRHFAVGQPPKVRKKAKAGLLFQNPWICADFHHPERPAIRFTQYPQALGEGFGELRMRMDTGSMWVEEYWGAPRGRQWQKEVLVENTEGPVFHQFVTEGEFLPGEPENGNTGNHWPGFRALRFQKRYRFYHELDYFTLDVTLHWTGCNTRVSLHFPTGMNPGECTCAYETPFATTIRPPYFEVEERHEGTLRPLASNEDYLRAKGDWPALHWVRMSDHRTALTVANDGTPAHQLANGEIQVCLLRSGTKTADGGLTPPEGAMDNGRHRYHFAFQAHAATEPWRSTELGMRENRRPVALPGHAKTEGTMLDWEDRGLALSALHRLPNGRILLRLYECQGQAASLRLSGALAKGGALQECDAAGTPLPAPGPAPFQPFQIRSYLLPQPVFRRFPRNPRTKEKTP
ncbi:MAG: GntR family transcriptional regulator [Oligosphaeraceae bacterium]